MVVSPGLGYSLSPSDPAELRLTLSVAITWALLELALLATAPWRVNRSLVGVMALRPAHDLRRTAVWLAT